MTLRKFAFTIPFLLALMLAMAMMPASVSAEEPYVYKTPEMAIEESSHIGSDCVQYDDSMESASIEDGGFTATIDAIEGHELRFYESEDRLHQYVFVCPPPGETFGTPYSGGRLKETTAQLANAQQAVIPEYYPENKKLEWNGVVMTD